MTPRFGPAALHDSDEWRQRHDAQIEAAIACSRECFDESSSTARRRFLAALDGLAVQKMRCSRCC